MAGPDDADDIERAGGPFDMLTFADRTAGQSKMSRAIVLEAVWKVPALRLAALVGRL